MPSEIFALDEPVPQGRPPLFSKKQSASRPALLLAGMGYEACSTCRTAFVYGTTTALFVHQAPFSATTRHVRRIRLPVPYRISPTAVFMGTGGRATEEDSGTGLRDVSNNPAASRTNDLPLQSSGFDVANTELDEQNGPVVDADDDSEFVKWATSGADVEEDDDLPMDQYLALDTEPTKPISSIPLDDDDIDQTIDFEDGDNEEEDEEEDEEDDEMAARADADDFDEDVVLSPLSKRGRNLLRTSPAGGVEQDANDEIPDDDFIESFVDDLPPVFTDGDDVNSSNETEEILGPQMPLDEDDLEGTDEALFEEESDEDIQSAANILSNSGLLGLGVDGDKRADMSAVTSFALGRDKPQVDVETPLEDLDYPDDPVDLDDDSTAETIVSLDDYKEPDEEEIDDEFTLTSKSSVGRIWELNDDNYVTITDPGQSYAYELDEEDEEDQEMATVRRGKQGGWSGGLARNSSSQLPEGSKEWIARKSYELIAESNQTEMFRWTRRHQDPPPSIQALFPKKASNLPPLGKTTLKFSTPDSVAEIIGTDSSAVGSDFEEVAPSVDEGRPNQNALERSMNFPNQYKFKVEGVGDLVDSVQEVIERVLGNRAPDSAFHVEPSGRYERVEFVLQVENARQVTDIYDSLRNLPSVKFSYG